MVAKRRENVGGREWKILQNVGEEKTDARREKMYINNKI